MKKIAMAGLAAVLGLVALTGAAMAQPADVDAMVVGLQPDVGIYELSQLTDGDELALDVLFDVDVAPDRLTLATVLPVPEATPMAARGSASSTMVDDAMRLWRVRTADAYTSSPGLLI